jgi:hypothetical protein
VVIVFSMFLFHMSPCFVDIFFVAVV